MMDRCKLDAAVHDSLLPAKKGGGRENEYSRCCPTSTIFRPNKGKDHSHKQGRARVVDYVATLGRTATTIHGVAVTSVPLESKSASITALCIGGLG